MASISNFTQQQFDSALKETVTHILLNPKLIPQPDEPRAFLLGGQSGSGKTTLHKVIAEELNQNVIVINGDEYRKSHPNFARIKNRYGLDTPTHTAKWSSQITEALIDALSQQKYNLIIEGTMRTSDVPLRTANLLHERGYSVSLAIMAVKPEISLISCRIRYEMMRLAGTTPRATNPEHHNQIVHDIVENLKVLEQSGAFESIWLFNRAAEYLFPSREATSASATLHEVLFGAWGADEQAHYAFLQQKLESLQRAITNMPSQLDGPQNAKAAKQTAAQKQAACKEWVQRWDSSLQSFFSSTGCNQALFQPTTSENLDEVLNAIQDENAERISLGLSREEYDILLAQRRKA